MYDQFKVNLPLARVGRIKCNGSKLRIAFVVIVHSNVRVLNLLVVP